MARMALVIGKKCADKAATGRPRSSTEVPCSGESSSGVNYVK